MAEDERVSVSSAIAASDYSAILAWVAEDGWSDQVAADVHDACVAWAERAIANRAVGTCRDLADLMARLRMVRGEAALDSARPSTSAEWRGIEQVLDEHIAQAEDDGAHRASVLGRKHVGNVLELLRLQPGNMLTQQALLQALNEKVGTRKMRPPQLSQLLSTMESARLISRDRSADANAPDGRVKWVRLLEDAEVEAGMGTPPVLAPSRRPLHGWVHDGEAA